VITLQAAYLTVDPDQHSTAERPLLSPFKAFVSLVRDDALAGVKEVEVEVEVALGRSTMCTHTLYGTESCNVSCKICDAMRCDAMRCDAL
jgi:hypothetical protein